MHDLQQIFYLGGHRAKAIDKLCSQGFAFRIRAQCADTAIEAEPHRQIAHIGIGDQHRQAQIDVGRPVAILGAEMRPFCARISATASSSIC